MFDELNKMRKVAKCPELREGVSCLALQLYKEDKLSENDLMSIAQSYVTEMMQECGTREVYEAFYNMNQEVEYIADYLCAKALLLTPTWVIERYFRSKPQDHALSDLGSRPKDVEHIGLYINEYTSGSLPDNGLVWAEVDVLRALLEDLRKRIEEAYDHDMYGHFDETENRTAQMLRSVMDTLDEVIGENND